ncbi:flagellar filament capping protein FliD [Geobacter sp. DSM 9736]|uniref:flagellar filament capping protein FliD n=1 Tax=Geobacter sp. DSM 9736 TaxID=1277350 RepID=UPI000B50188D|nr:flagellar filament capping protein FliD [Geobacter sp. DSM 9736]SNB47027.1 flagellar hook-associated protein 2 [Geobacter sp. DSM 9736]
MADLSIGGLATGIDTTTLISQLMKLERRPQQILASKRDKVQGQVDAFTTINSLLSSFKSIVAGMNTPTSFIGKTSSVGDGTVLTATAASTAATGAHDIVVTTLAKSERQVSDNTPINGKTGYDSATDLNLNTGTIVITGGALPVNVTIAEGQNSLSGIAAAINSSGANVTASVLNDGTSSPYRLVITGKDTGNYAVDFSGLTTVPVAPNGPAYVNPSFIKAGPTYQAGSAAVFSVDGVAITKTSNTISDVIPGVTFTLLKEGGATTNISIGNDIAGVTKKINEFIGSYNSIMSQIDKQTDYNASTKKGGVLSGDSTLRTIKDKLQNILTTPVSGITGKYSILAEIGIKTNYVDGTLTLDSTQLSSALNSNFDDVVKLFTQNGGVSGLQTSEYGVAEQYKLVIDNLTHAYEGPTSTANGLISTRIRGLNDTIKNINDQIDAMELRMVQKEDNLKKQFSALEKLVSNLQGQGSSLLNILYRQ